MTFPNEKVHSAILKGLTSELLVALFSVGIWCDHVGNCNSGDDALPRDPEP